MPLMNGMMVACIPCHHVHFSLSLERKFENFQIFHKELIKISFGIQPQQPGIRGIKSVSALLK